MSRVSRDLEGNRPTIDQHTIAVVAAIPSTHLREPTGSIAGSIERQVKRQNQQIDAAIQELRPLRPDPLIATETSSMIFGMTNPAISSLPSLDITLPTEWQGNLLFSDVKLLHKIPFKSQNEIISYVDRYSSDRNLLGAGDVVAYAKELIDGYYS